MDLLTLGIGGLIGFLSAIGKDFLLEQSKNKIKTKDFKREKLEEIFILMDKVSQESLKPLKYKGSLDGIGAKLGMTIRFYFPDLNKDYQDFLKVFQEVTQKTITLDDKINLTEEDIKMFYTAYGLFIDKIVLESKKYV
ncbi:hypothetical protein CPG37_01465 [Malaciobacter canalis]|uniref:Uncharacterized protein n=1 Tax=Malaciobacter canalis TaxID=1912871 RepID=A0ABX4LU85_9BACT|nr:hypothetical protein [Malaciobacter canalis]PHO11140.1 hypothetical protein CPG37_01465 [Malaciobacter canalis]QEE33228.1 hypothetical protein ACAN_1757 [Malaciobacter canalis]